MTAINLIVAADHAIIATDTRGRSPLGPDIDVPKVIPVPHMRLAVATRGRMDRLIKAVGAICAGAFDFDSAKAFLADAYGRVGLDDTDIVIGGWSVKAGKPAGFVVSKANTDGKIMDIPHVLVTPVVPSSVADAFAEDPIMRLPDLMAVQASGSSDVGGYLNICQVGEAGIESFTAMEIKALPGVRRQDGVTISPTPSSI